MTLPMDSERDAEAPTRRRPGFAPTMRAVLWSFFGVRRKSAYEKDAANLNPVYVIITGIVAAALFVVTLLVIVNLVVR